jgi:hypothetical protein
MTTVTTAEPSMFWNNFFISISLWCLYFYSYGIFLTSVVAFPPLFLGFTMVFCREVNLKCIDAYAVLEWANDTKLHIFATKHKANTTLRAKSSRISSRRRIREDFARRVGQHIQWTINSLWWLSGPSRGTLFRGGVWLNLPESMKSSKFTWKP